MFVRVAARLIRLQALIELHTVQESVLLNINTRRRYSVKLIGNLSLSIQLFTIKSVNNAKPDTTVNIAIHHHVLAFALKRGKIVDERAIERPVTTSHSLITLSQEIVKHVTFYIRHYTR